MRQYASLVSSDIHARNMPVRPSAVARAAHTLSAPTRPPTPPAPVQVERSPVPVVCVMNVMRWAAHVVPSPKNPGSHTHAVPAPVFVQRAFAPHGAPSTPAVHVVSALHVVLVGGSVKFALHW